MVHDDVFGRALAVTDVSENIESGNMGVEETPNTEIGSVIEGPPESQKGELSAESSDDDEAEHVSFLIIDNGLAPGVLGHQ